MKRIILSIFLFSSCCPSHASDLFIHSFKKDLQEEKVGPMLFLVKSIRKYPTKKRFILKFFTFGPRSLYKTTVNVNLKNKVTYVRTSQMGWGTSLTKFTQVDVKKIRRLYHDYTPAYGGDSTDNFLLLELVGCPKKIISNHVVAVNGPDKN